MRQSQQKNRMRGRGRKMPNPMSRNYESNGPDVKIRGNAAHVAEKYTSLARDAFSSGDTVMGENYLQHAEHYNRIVAAAQAQAQQFRGDEQPGAGFGNAPAGRPQPEIAGFGDDDDGAGEAFQTTDGEAGEGAAAASTNGDQQSAGGQPQSQRPYAGNGQGEQGSRHHRNRRRPRYGENGRDDGNRDRAPREFDSAPGRANGGPGREAGDTGAEGHSGISSDASMLPQSILGGPSEPPSSERGSDD